MPKSDLCSEPMKVTAFEGAIVVAGPEGPGPVALTPEAAVRTAWRLLEAAREARPLIVEELERDATRKPGLYP